MNLGDLGKKAQDFLGTEQGEQRSDDVLDKVADLVDKKTGGTHDAQIQKARDAADARIGTEGTREHRP